MGCNRGAINAGAVVGLVFITAAVFDVSLLVFAHQARLFKIVVGPEEKAKPEPPSIARVKELLSTIEKEKESIAKQQEALRGDEGKVGKLKEQAEAQLSILGDQQEALSKTLKEITVAIKEKDAADVKKLELLVKMYSSMKADAVAAVFEKMDEAAVTEILLRMKPKIAAAVMGKMKPSKTSALSDKMKKQ